LHITISDVLASHSVRPTEWRRQIDSREGGDGKLDKCLKTMVELSNMYCFSSLYIRMLRDVCKGGSVNLVVSNISTRNQLTHEGACEHRHEIAKVHGHNSQHTSDRLAILSWG